MQPQNVKDPFTKFEYLEIVNATMLKERYGLLTKRIEFWKTIINQDDFFLEVSISRPRMSCQPSKLYSLYK